MAIEQPDRAEQGMAARVGHGHGTRAEQASRGKRAARARRARRARRTKRLGESHILSESNGRADNDDRALRRVCDGVPHAAERLESHC